MRNGATLCPSSNRSARCVPHRDAPPRFWRRPMTCSRARKRASAQGKPWSFLHISKPEIDLDPATDPYDGAVYAKAAENLKRMIAAGVLIRDAKPCYYVYRPHLARPRQTGLAAVASLADYATNRIRRHEHTTPVKEDDRVRQIEAVNAQTGPVMIGYPTAPQIDAMLARATTAAPARRRHCRRWRAPPAVGGRRRRHRRGADPRLRCPAGALHRRRPSPLGRGRARREIPRRRRAGLFPRRDVSAERDDDPRLQPRAARFERAQPRSAFGGIARSASRLRRAISRCVRPRRTKSACIWPATGTG